MQAILVCAFTFVAAPRIVSADYDQSINQDASSGPYALYQQCTQGMGCQYFNIEFGWESGFAVDFWQYAGPGGNPAGYTETMDYEEGSYGWAEVGAAALGGQCCPPAQIGIRASQFIVECWHNRSDCGSAYVAYRSQSDSNWQTAGTSCSSYDSCDASHKYTGEQAGYADPGVCVLAATYPIGYATPYNHVADNRCIVWDMGQ